MRHLFRERARITIFTADRLLYHLRAAAIEVFYELAQNTPDGSNERDEWLMAACQQSIALASEFQQQISTPLSQEASS
ncbi:unnamed protein product [Rotaria sp. Silwood1]|nr:unnamed protein product [Rotaria sp. Silwood1]